MNDEIKTNAQLIAELTQLRERVTELETTRAEYTQVEKALRESEENFRNLVESLPDGIIIGSTDGRHVYANRRATELLQYTREEMLQTSQKDLADPSAYPQLKQRLQDRIAGRPVPSSYETTIRRKDGTGLSVEVTGIRTMWQGQICDLAMFHDITARKQANEALQDRELKLKILFELLPVGVSVLGADNHISYLNPALEKILGITHSGLLKGEYSQRTYLKGDGTTMLPEEFASVRAMNEQRAVDNVETGVVKEDGQVVWVNVNAVPVAISDWRIVLVTADISARKQAEEALHESNAYLENLINYANAPIIVWDAQFRITRFNHAFEFLTGYSEGEMIGHPLELLFPAAQIDTSMALIRKTMTGERWESVEIAIMHRDESIRTVLWNSATLFSPDGQTPIATIAQGQDITKRKKLEEELQKRANADELTGIANRRHLLEMAHIELKRTSRLKHPLAIAIIDIDFFKQINDSFGHAVGDRVLIAFTKICQKNIREIDLFARFGGDEFALLLPETSREQAFSVVERIRLALFTQSIALDGKWVSLTISSGITNWRSDQQTFDDLVRQADQALYHAKKRGRNQSVEYDDL